MAHDGSVVDKPVESAEMLGRLAHDPTRALGEAEVGRDTKCLAAGRRHRLSGQLQRFDPAPDEHDLGAGRPKAQRRCRPDAAPGACHDYDRA